jgi:hypothetical protein
MAAAARIVIEASAVKAVSAARASAQRAAVRVVAEVAATVVARVTVRPRVAAAIAKDRAARGAMNRAHAPIRVRVPSRAAEPIRVVASIKVHDLIRRLVGIRVPVPTRTAGLSRRVGSTPVALAPTKMAAPIRVDASNPACAPSRSGVLIKTVGRTKALCATISATAL